MQKLIKKIQFSGVLTLKSGLHIGGNHEGIGIGDIDNPIIKHPVTQEPYIPGSSLKGKVRSLLEKLLGYTDKHSNQIPNGPSKGENVVTTLFGKTQKDKNDNNTPSRLIFRDSFLEDKSKKKLLESENTQLLYTEVKMEAIIDRVTSAADPRPIERVPAGSVFDFKIILNIFENDPEEKLLDYVKVGLRLLEDDYLGGSGSRGSGEITIGLNDLRQKKLKDYEEDNDWQPYTTN